MQNRRDFKITGILGTKQDCNMLTLIWRESTNE